MDGILIMLGVLLAVAAVIAAVYFLVIKGTRADRPRADGEEHRPGPGRS